MLIVIDYTLHGSHTHIFIQNWLKWSWWNVKLQFVFNIYRWLQPTLQKVWCVLQHYSIKHRRSGSIVQSQQQYKKEKAKLQTNKLIFFMWWNLWASRATNLFPQQSTHIHNVCIIVCIRSLVGSLGAFSFHKLHGLLFDCLDALWGAVLLLVLQVALEEELDLFHWNAQVDHTIKECPEGDRKLENSSLWSSNLVLLHLTSLLTPVLSCKSWSDDQTIVKAKRAHLTSFCDPCLTMRSMKTDQRSVRFG